MIRPIVLYGHPVLRKKAQPVDDFEEGKQLIADMFETMHNARGIGLAAPQINILKQIFVVDTVQLAEGYDDDEMPLGTPIKKAFINPQIIEHSGNPIVYEEGCLSIPDVRANVERPFKVLIKYQDEEGQWHEEEYDGLTARVIMHEYDHLQGKLFIDYLSPLKKQMLSSKLKNIQRGKVKPFYPVILPNR
ncbi:MAG: peptide deformylase [Chlorobi bacterium]|nr:peptide deformylase [Chlorobiota bacterium]